MSFSELSRWALRSVLEGKENAQQKTMQSLNSEVYFLINNLEVLPGACNRIWISIPKTATRCCNIFRVLFDVLEKQRLDSFRRYIAFIAARRAISNYYFIDRFSIIYFSYVLLAHWTLWHICNEMKKVNWFRSIVAFIHFYYSKEKIDYYWHRQYANCALSK